jgi:hypothetical protein
MKKYLYTTIWILLFQINNVSANTPDILPKVWLPWDNIKRDFVDKIWWKFISTFIEYVAIIAVISLMLSWIMYLIANWDEEKVKKAKNWIIWSLVWVLLSISAWWIINIINNFKLN